MNNGTTECDHSDSGFVVLDEQGAHYECYSCGYEWIDTSSQIDDIEEDDDIVGEDSNDFDDDDIFEE